MKYRLFLTELKKGGPLDPIYLLTPTSELPLQGVGNPLGMRLVMRQRYKYISELLAPYIASPPRPLVLKSYSCNTSI
jgi:hypothetical protein